MKELFFQQNYAHPTPIFLYCIKYVKRAVITYFGIKYHNSRKLSVLQSSPKGHLLCLETSQVSMEVLYMYFSRICNTFNSNPVDFRGLQIHLQPGKVAFATVPYMLLVRVHSTNLWRSFQLNRNFSRVE